ncbi:MAG TPA: 2-amino-4-hydroxy-6-hydroxymethyldihydropteridine diphosphokinase [Chromatiales bacterium]|nr:2-amino-4-hydroxy-6-hydroxymethyldihydropteridine diphosphokinase [Chromatiales bacterium]
MTTVFIGLGSNLDRPEKQITTALKRLEELPQTQLMKRSSLYLSPPMGPSEQPDYINAVALLDTGLLPLALLDELQAIERAHGRQRTQRWGARTLDLDLLLYGDEAIDLPDLRVPHPGIAERAFVLEPLAEIAPTQEVPGLGRVQDLLLECDAQQVRKIDE